MIPKIRSVRPIETAPGGINLLVIKIETTEDGLYGLGCATFSYRSATIKHLVETYIEPLLIGREVDRISDIWQLMHQNAYWRSGPIENNAISGVDMALWDIKGKMANMPLYQLLGGKLRDGIPVYQHADGDDVDELIEHIEQYREVGLRYVRCQNGIYGGTPYGTVPQECAKGVQAGTYINSNDYMRNTVKMFEKLRDHFGDEIELLHDVHERISPIQARSFCHELDPFRLFFLEDVVSPEHVSWLREIHNYCTTPLSHGELYVNSNDWHDAVVNRGVDYIRCHISDIGGITPALRAAAFADSFGIRTCWHCPPDLSPVSASAIINIDLALPNFGLQEWSGIETYQFLQQSGDHDVDAAMHEVFSNIPEYGNDGYVYGNELPGLGVDIDEKEAAKYPCDHPVTLWTQTRNSDGSLQTP
ncbi:MAG: enolase C-terminal domain-like protein [Lachnospiraceae bacterium]|nr:enolase C-terminal domain-like protein [Lachnospiraceae bacterium]